MSQEDFDAFAQSLVAKRKGMTATLNLDEAFGTNADENATLLKLQQRTGIPAFEFPDMKKEAEKQVFMEDAYALPSHSPATTRFLSDHRNALVAHDDIPALQAIEKTIFDWSKPKPVNVLDFGETSAERARKSFGFIPRQFVGGREQIQLGQMQEQRRVAGDETPSYEEEILKQRVQEAEAGRDSLPLRVLGGAANMFGMLSQTTQGAVDEGLAGASAGAAAGALMSAPAGGIVAPLTAAGGAALGFGAGLAYGTFREFREAESGNAFSQLEQVRGKNGEKLDKDLVNTMSFVYGVGSAGLELASLGVLAGPVKQAAKYAFGQEALKQATRWGAVINGLWKWQQSPLAEAGEEFSQQLLQGALTNLAMKYSPGEFRQLSGEEIGREAFKAAQEAYLSTLLVGVPGPLASLHYELNAIDQAEYSRETLNALAGQVQNSATYNRLPEATRNHIEAVVEERGAAKNVMIDAQAFQSHFQMDAEGVAEQLGVDLEAYRAAVASQGEFAVSLPRYAEKIIGTEHHAALEMDIRADNIEYTPRQAEVLREQFNANFEEIMSEAQQIYEDERANEEPVHQVFRTIYEQSVAAGRPVTESKGNAALAAATYRSLAAFAKDGSTALDIFNRRTLNIGGVEQIGGMLFSEKDRALAAVADLEQNVTASGPVAAGGQRLNATASANSVVARWALDSGYATRDVIGALKKFASGKKLTPKQQNIIDAWRVEEEKLKNERFQPDRDKKLAIKAAIDRIRADLFREVQNEKEIRPSAETQGEDGEYQGNVVDAHLSAARDFFTAAGYGDAAIGLAVQAREIFAEFRSGEYTKPQADKAFSSLLKELEEESPHTYGAVVSMVEELRAMGHTIRKEKNQTAAGEILEALVQELNTLDPQEQIDGTTLFQPDKSYQISHRPMSVAGGAATLDDLSKAFGEDIYGKNALQFFGSGDSREKYIVKLLASLRGKPDALVTIYRGVPKDVKDINAGDWVTLDKSVAEDYASDFDDGKVISLQVTAKDVTSWADSLLEFGYFPNDGASLFQPSGQDPLGKISFDKFKTKFTVEFFAKANHSTFAHELGHFYMEVLNAMVESGEANDIAAQDLQKIFSFLGVNSYDEITMEHHEKFADGFLNYLAEGKAPTEELASVFARFKVWLGKLVKALKIQQVELSDDIRQVYDNMLSAGDDIQKVQDREIFTDAEQAGMTEEAWQDYLADADRARQIAEEKHTARLMKAQLKADREAITQEVIDEAREMPIYKAITRLKSDLMLDREALLSLYGELPKGFQFMAKEDGANPEAVAEELGFGSVDEMVQRIAETPSMSTYVKAETKLRMEERFGVSREERQKSATDAVYNSQRVKVLEKRLNALRGKIQAGKIPRPNLQEIRQRAADMVGNMKAIELQPYQYVVAGRKAARRVYDAIRKGDYAEAVKAQNAEIVNHFLYIEATKARDDVDKVRALAVDTMKAKTLGRLGLAGDEYLHWAQEILSRYSFERLSNSQIAAQNETLAEFLASVQEMSGVAIPVDPRIVAGQPINYREATVNELRDMHDTIKVIRKMASTINSVRVREETMAYEQLHGALIDQIVTEFPESVARRKTTGSRSVFDDITYGLEDIAFGVMRPQFLFEKLDGEKDRGLFRDVFWRYYNDGSLKENELKARILPMVNSAAENISNARMQQPVFIKSMGRSFPVYDLIGMALNFGNASNGDKFMRGGMMIDGVRVPFPPDAVQEIVDALTKEEMDLVQSLWDMVETLKPDMAELQKRLTGLEPVWIEATPVTTKHGVYRGGYWPIVFDWRDSQMGVKQEAAKSVQDAVQVVPFTQAFTRQGQYIERTSAAAPLSYDWGVILSRHLDHVIKDIAYREFLIVARKSMAQDVIDVMNDRLGENYAREIQDWEKRIVGVDIPSGTAIDGLLRTTRTNLTVAALGFKVANAFADAIITQGQALSRIPAATLAGAVYNYAFNVDGSRGRIAEMSGYMKHLWMNIDRDLSDGMKKLTEKHDVRSKMMRLAMQSRSYAYEIAAGMVWLGAYEDAQAKGMTPDESVRYADDTVRTTSDAGRAGDLNKYEASRNEWMKSFTMFLGPMTIAANAMAKAKRVAGRRGVSDPLVWKTAVGFWIGNAIIYEIMVGRGPDEDDDWKWYAVKMAAFPFSAVPGVRDVASTVERRLTGKYTFPREMPFFAATDAVWKAAESGYKYFAEDGDGGKAIKNTLRAVGLTAGVPSSQIEITGEYLYDVMSGEYEARHLWSPATDIFIRRQKQ